MIDLLLLNYQAKINARLDILIPESEQSYDAVVRAARYSLLSPGKRIRPVLLLEFYKLCGGNDDCAYNFACALEMIHTYSLIHDDLPCMDNDDFRRSNPSCHKKFGESVALLAGDALLTEAFSTAAKTLGIPAERIGRALAVLASCAGITGMIGGQVIDTVASENATSLEGILEMYRLKTGALLRAAAVCGCILAGGNTEEEKAAASFGEKLGIAFQLIDDLLDVEGNEQLLGKPIGSDERNGKNNAIAIAGTQTCHSLADEYSRAAIDVLTSFEGDTSNLEKLTEYLLLRKN